jgi:hypothetical protein
MRKKALATKSDKKTSCNFVKLRGSKKIITKSNKKNFVPNVLWLSDAK